jgi:hypothetical protein
MKRALAAFAVGVAVAVVGAPGAPAATSGHLSGGGTASISQVAFNVSLDGSGGATGSFECLMAGRSASVVIGPPFNTHIMQVHATPTAGSISGSVVSFSGPGILIMDGGRHQSIHVSVWANVATQQFQLTVVEVGAMPLETFTSGGISLR